MPAGAVGGSKPLGHVPALRLSCPGWAKAAIIAGIIFTGLGAAEHEVAVKR